MENLTAGGILLFGSLGLLLVSLKNKWGFVLGLIGQLFFLLAAYSDHMRGLLIFSLIQIIIWVIGIYRWFYYKGK